MMQIFQITFVQI